MKSPWALRKKQESNLFNTKKSVCHDLIIFPPPKGKYSLLRCEALAYYCTFPENIVLSKKSLDKLTLHNELSSRKSWH